MLDTITLPISQAPRDPTGAERQRRFREKHKAQPENPETKAALEARLMQLARRGDNRTSVELVARQPSIMMERTEAGDLILVQDDWPNEEARVFIAADVLDQFIDRLTDALGYGGYNPRNESNAGRIGNGNTRPE